MSMPFYVAPEQVMKDRADYARKGIARGRALVASSYADGVVIVAENPSRTLRKVSEIYDRIAFAGVGKYNEFDQLRIAGVRHADLKGYSFSREDVAGKSLANEYSTVLGAVFTREMKPLEVEILVVEIRDEGCAFYQVRYDGSMTDTTHYASIGGDGDKLVDVIRGGWKADMPLREAAKLARRALAGSGNGSSLDDLDERTLEIAVLDRSRKGRTFRRVVGEEARALLGA